ncbi:MULTISPECIES: helix-turn-helix domain-containing protein [Paenibacillus]|uniref:helix-turn-helix domain-containing protein n=1 Tax=Paenibacillus TaxID=44249 RepID=UPI00096F6A9E|nr:helix-turn-helix transcriptional regulator [Paenibacillus odorifer]OMD06450.1 hypothetical protein BJP50_11060 [Paenibacillus odorifer]
MFGDVLKKLRSDRKLSLDQFVKEINNRYNTSFSKSMVSRWENNLTDPKMESVRVISDFFNVSLNFLLDSSSLSSDAEGKSDEPPLMDKKVRSLAREIQELDSESVDALSLIVKSMKKRGREAKEQ